jgi:glycogen debranching enzyme
MPFKVQVGPHQISIHHGQTVLVGEPDGQIRWPSEKGLYFFDTRVISSWAIYANGESWELLNGGATTPYASRMYLTNRAIPTADGIIPPRTLGLVLSRLISDGMHEDLDVTNNGMRKVDFQLEMALRCDFADIFEVKSNNIVRRGHIDTTWSQTRQQLRTSYHNGDFVRAVTVAPSHHRPKATYSNGRLNFQIVLDPGEAWHCCLLYTLEDGERLYRPPHECSGQHHGCNSSGILWRADRRSILKASRHRVSSTTDQRGETSVVAATRKRHAHLLAQKQLEEQISTEFPNGGGKSISKCVKNPRKNKTA